MSAEKRSRPGYAGAAKSDAAQRPNVDNSTPWNYWGRAVTRCVALDAIGHDQRGRRLCLDDVPAGGRVVVDVCGCPFPVAEAAREIVAAQRRGVVVGIMADREGLWLDALERVA